MTAFHIAVLALLALGILCALRYTAGLGLKPGWRPHTRVGAQVAAAPDTGASRPLTAFRYRGIVVGMATQRLIEGAAVSPALGWRATCRDEECRWDARDVSKRRVQLACARHPHPCWAPSYGRIREDTITRRNDG